MDLDALKTIFNASPVTEHDLEATYQQFTSEQAVQNNETVDEFALYLHRHKKIDTAHLASILTQRKIETSPLDVLQLPHEGSIPEGTEHEPSLSYEFLGEVGQGGMGEILLAKDKHLLRTVAFKRLHDEYAHKPEVLEQFLNEVQITSQLEHPNVVPIYSLEVSSKGSIAYAMKLVQGKTFQELIQESRGYIDRKQDLPKTHSLPILLEHFLKVCDALEFAHSKGVLHRDLKPANIMIGAYHEVCVMDWGIACLLEDLPQDAERKVVGTPRYMSPEQAAGFQNQLDARSDLFCLGLILFELVSLNSAVPMEKTTMETLKKVIKGELNPLVHYAAEFKIPAELQAIVARATARKRKDRYASVQELAEDLRRYLRGEAVLAQPDTWLQALLRWISQNREKTLTAFFLLLFLSASLFSGGLYYRHVSLLAAQEHEAQMHHATNLVARRGNEIDQHFFYLESLLRSYGTAVLQRLRYGTALPGTYYTVDDYRNPQTRPPRTEFIPKYGTEVNVDWSVILAGPGADPQRMHAQAQSMHPLQHLMKQIVIDSYPQSQQQGFSTAELDDLIRERKMPILWIFTGLESGFYIGYPSTYNYPEGYDPRQRPWYTMAKKSGTLHWQEPYRTTGGEVDLPCVMPLYDEHGQFQGVSVIEMTFDYIRHHFLELKIPGVLESSLVNHKGQIIISTIDHYSAARQSGKKQTKTDLITLSNEQVVQALPKLRSGHQIEVREDGNQVYIYYYLSALQWYYVIRADEQAFLEAVHAY